MAKHLSSGCQLNNARPEICLKSMDIPVPMRSQAADEKYGA